MKKILPLLLMASACFSTGCYARTGRASSAPTACQRYVHRYGLEVSPEEWVHQGQCGTVQSTLRNGVDVCSDYDQGVLHGETTRTFPHSGAVQSCEQYDRGALKEQITYYPSGKIERTVSYQGDATRVEERYYDQGGLCAHEEIANSQLLRAAYFTPAGEKEAEVLNGTGERANRDQYGLLHSIDTIKGGTLGTRTTYHGNGTPSTIISYCNNVPHGESRAFHPGGEPATCEEWADGERHGLSCEFQNGAIVAEVPYQHGMRHGLERRYDEGGRLVEEISWYEGGRQGPCRQYVGGQTFTSWFWQDRPVSAAVYAKAVQQMQPPPRAQRRR